jgi:hypothetical protein
MKQTAVDWLIAELFKKGIINADAWVWDESIDIKQIIEHAKETEKEQIIYAHGVQMVGVNNHKCVTGEQYYKETYKQD